MPGDIVGVFEDVDDSIKIKLIDLWKSMSDQEKDHFINQVSLALSVWGSDETGKRLVIEVLKALVTNGSLNLIDFGLYVDALTDKKATAPADRLPKIKRASIILEGYRIKNSLPSEPHKEFGL